MCIYTYTCMPAHCMCIRAYAPHDERYMYYGYYKHHNHAYVQEHMPDVQNYVQRYYDYYCYYYYYYYYYYYCNYYDYYYY